MCSVKFKPAETLSFCVVHVNAYILSACLSTSPRALLIVGEGEERSSVNLFARGRM